LVLEIPVIYVKDKQAFTKKDGIMKILGNPVHVARDYASKGTKLIHIIDEDVKKGLTNNLDIYDKLTFFINIEVECGDHIEIIDKLLAKKARVVLRLPTNLDLSLWADHERLLVGIVDAKYTGKANGVHDVIIEEADEKLVKKFQDLGKRVIAFGLKDQKMKKQLFGIIKGP
jgi:uncharacterized protein related to proFAR isomerase